MSRTALSGIIDGSNTASCMGCPTVEESKSGAAGIAGSLSAGCLLTRIQVHSAPPGQQVSGLVKMMNLAIDYPGFLSAELIPPYPPEQNEWRLLQRFLEEEQLTAWRNSIERQGIINEMLADFPSANKEQLIVEELTHSERGSVATAIVTRVKQGMESSYRHWESKVQLAQAQFEGYRGSYIQPPTKDVQSQWTTMLRFDTPEALDKWLNCRERKELLQEGVKYIDSVDFQMLTNSFPGWFPTDPKTGKGPAVYKTFLLVLVGLYPIVMCEIKFLMPLLHGLNPALANFIGNILSVAATTWITVPACIKVFDWWVLPPDDERKAATELKGNLILAAIFIAEIAALSRLF